jgi:hypothetical protein
MEMLAEYWYIWAIIIAYVLGRAIYRLFKPRIKGKQGELATSVLLHTLSSKDYRIFDDVILDTKDRTTQIDHIVISRYGVFVIEAKNYSGSIYGSDDLKQWTQKLGAKTNRFHSPVMQNAGHIKAINALLPDIDKSAFVSIIAFAAKAKVKVDSKEIVTYIAKVPRAIRKYKEEILSLEDANRLIAALNEADRSKTVSNREHVENLKRSKLVR